MQEGAMRQEPAEGANRAELYGVPQAVGLTPSPINVASVLVVRCFFREVLLRAEDFRPKAA